MGMMIEEWRDIDGFEGLYQISSFGRVRSVDHYVYIIPKNGKAPYMRLQKGRIMTLSYKGFGYKTIVLYKGKNFVGKSVHRIVAETFIPNPKNLPEVNHIDEDKTNNKVDNLEWVTRLENMRYGTAIERLRKTKIIPVVQMSLNGDIVKEWPSMIQAAKFFNTSVSRISYACRNGCTLRGSLWKYKDKKGPSRNSPHLWRSVIQLSANGDEIREWPSLKKAAASIDISPQGISAVCRGKQKTCGGYCWKYADKT